jgi:hypothetical protein
MYLGWKEKGIVFLPARYWKRAVAWGKVIKKVRPTIGSSRLGLRLSVFIGVILSPESKYNG